jgi:sterol desaturase/sphingolipid hydroxylase (fatty acid hydroxylase superfamily)
MTAKVGSRPERIRLFTSDVLEKTTVISPRGFASVWGPYLLLALYLSWGTASLAVSVGLLLVGLVCWTLFEYVMHRFLFHLDMKSEAGRYVIFVMHGNHHVEPEDGHRNMMPPIISLPWSAAVWAACLLLLGAKGSMVFLGFAIGYVIYDSVHYACHQMPMRGPLRRQLRRHHIRHHYAKKEGNYAITAIFWDRVFGTDVPAKGR